MKFARTIQLSDTLARPVQLKIVRGALSLAFQVQEELYLGIECSTGEVKTEITFRGGLAPTQAGILETIIGSGGPVSFGQDGDELVVTIAGGLENE